MLNYSFLTYLRSSSIRRINKLLTNHRCFTVASPAADNNVNLQDQRILKVAIVGTPNAGKSTLINQLVDRRVCAISKKVHTTRSKVRAIHVENNTQLIFLDTPGVVSQEETSKYNLDDSFVIGGENAVEEADAIGVIQDVSNRYTRSKLNPKILRLLHLYRHKHSFLVLNKIDAVKSKRTLLDLSTSITGGYLNSSKGTIKWSSDSLAELDIKKFIKKDSTWKNFSDIFMCSALLGQGTVDLKNYLLNAAVPGAWMFDASTFTDQSDVKIIEDAVRSKFLEYLPQEIPYLMNVQLEYMEQHEYNKLVIVVLVGCKNSRVSKMLLRNRGEIIRMIAKETEQALIDTFFCKIHLKLVVSDSIAPNKLTTNKEEISSWIS